MMACGGASSEGSRVEPLPQPSATKTYPIDLHRDSRVGMRMHVVFDHEEETITQNGDSPKQRQVQRGHIDAITTTLAVDEHHDSTRVHYDVKELTIDGKPAYTGPLDVTKAADAKDATVLLDGKPPDEHLRQALKDLLPLTVGGPSDDEIFGTTTPQPVGARWPIHGDLALADLLKDDALHATSLTGETTLEAVTACCLDIRAKVHIADLSAPKVNGTLEGSMDATFQALFPLDTSRSRTEEHETMRLHMKLTVDSGGTDTVVVVEGKLRTDRRFTEL